MVDVYSTCPSSGEQSPREFRRQMTDVAGWTDNSVCRGLLIYTDNRAIDPWAAAQYMIDRTERLIPLVAAQPEYMHPYTVARMISTISSLHERTVDLNLVIGGNRGDLRSLGCRLKHDDRYLRLIEYGRIVTSLLMDPEPAVHRGTYYQTSRAVIHPPLSAQFRPRIFMSGSSAAAVAAQRALDIVRLTYPQPLDVYSDPSALHGIGIRVGVIARDRSDDAWRVAHRRFPPDPRGEQAHDVASLATDSEWYAGMSAESRRPRDAHSTYWLHPFRTAREFCPYLVGSYDEVAEVLAGYFALGADTLILNVPRDEDDIPHAEIALARAAHRAEPASAI